MLFPQSLQRLICTGIALLAMPAAFAETVFHQLDNGMKVIIAEDHRAPVVLTQLWYKIGSIDEVPGKTGLSHALEHMMFKGTHTVPAGEYSSRISALGGEDNAYTSPEETVYHVNIAAQHLPTVLRLEADRMANLNFSDAAFRNEMKVIREERRQTVDDSPNNALYEKLLGIAWQKSANRTHTIGIMRDLHHLKPNDLRQWYRQWYAPNNATLIIVGDVNPEQTLATVKQYFGQIPARELPKRQDISERMERPAASAAMRANTKQPLMVLGYRVPHLQKLDDTMPYALDILGSILDGHSAARFSKNLVRGQQTAQRIDVSYDLLSRQPQLWTVFAMPANGTSTAKLRQLIEAQIADIAENGVSEEELQRAIRQEEANEIYDRDSIESRASLMGTLENTGFSYRDEAEIRRRLSQVTAQQVQEAARLLTSDRAVFVEMQPAR